MFLYQICPPLLFTTITDRQTTNFFTGSPLAALTTLSFSDNVDLQRSAALAFAEITEKEVRPVGRDTLGPILFLLSSHDTEVQRAASAALGNLAVNSTYPSPLTTYVFFPRRIFSLICHNKHSRQQTSYR